MEFQDKTLECIDCQQPFTFTAGEQEFYDRKGFKEVPKRCKSCREIRKQRRGGPGAGPAVSTGNDYGSGNSRYGGQAAGGGYSPRGDNYGNTGGGGGYSRGDNYGNTGGGGGYSRGDSYGNASGGARPQREMFDATCAACGASARVPFRPAANRPVYCRDCYANRSAGG